MSNDDVRAELEKILASAGFVEDGPLFRSLVESALSGNPDRLDESALKRLRSRLEEYYAGAGKNDSVVIELPEGSCSPVFRGKAAFVGYQPSLTRKLLMFGLCLIGLILVWVWFWIGNR